MILKAHRTNNGYDSEELYFEKLNRELISRLKTSEKGSSPEKRQEAESEQKGATVLTFKPRAQANEKKAA